MMHAFKEKRRYGLIILGIALVVIALAVRIRLRASRWNKTDIRRNSTTGRQRLEGEVIALDWMGFVLRTFRHSAGPFVLLINKYGRFPAI